MAASPPESVWQLLIGPRAQPDVGQDGSGARLEVLAAEREEAVERVRVGAGKLRLGPEPSCERVHRGFGLTDAGAPRQVAEHGLTGARRRLLRQVADGAAADHLPAVGLLEPGQHAQQGRLADPVRADDADPVARRDDQRDAVEHLAGGKALRDITCSE